MDELVDLLDSYDSESQEAHDKWLKEARTDYLYYRGDQWDEEVKNELIREKRPVLTLNLIRSRVRALVGYEQRSRYDMKTIPVAGGGDQTKAEILNGLIKQIESDNEAQFTHSDMYREGIITGRGWAKIDIDYTYNLLGEITIGTVSADEIQIDPKTRRYDLLDSRYIKRVYEIDEDDLVLMYPDKKSDIVSEGVNEAESREGRPRHVVKEFWYRTNEKRYFFIDRQTQSVDPIEDKNDPTRLQAIQQEPERYAIAEKNTKVVKYAVKLGEKILDEGDTPYDHPYFPYVNYFAEFIRAFDDLEPDTPGIVRDLRDPQNEKNKRRSQYLDKIQREIASGFMYEDGAILNPEPLSVLAKRPWYEIKVKPGSFNLVKRIESQTINPALLQLDQYSDKDFDDISLIVPALLGQTEGSRESGKATALRQQTGNVTIGPYQDNMRLTRRIMARIILSLIGQNYSVARMVRILTDSGDIQQVMVNPEEQGKVEGMMQIALNPSEVDRYDVRISETPTTPSIRTAQFFEVMEMRAQGIPVPEEVIVKASDVPYKEEILQAIAQAKQAAMQAQKNALGTAQVPSNTAAPAAQ